MPNQFKPRFWDASSGILSCGKCGNNKPYSEFHKDASSTYKYAYWCKECACANGRKHHNRRMKDDPTYARNSSRRYIKQKYKLDIEQYDELWKKQKVCVICNVELLGGAQTHLDHDHKTGKLREFLCTNCNRGLGHFQDSINNLTKAIEYLSKHNVSVEDIREGTCL